MTGLPEPSSPASGCDPDVRGRRNAPPPTLSEPDVLAHVGRGCPEPGEREVERTGDPRNTAAPFPLEWGTGDRVRHSRGCLDPPVSFAAGRRPRNPIRREVSLRILFCTLGYDTLAAGGAERQARLQAEELVRRGHRVTVVAPLLEGARSETINGVDVRRLPMIDRPIIRNVTYLPFLAMFLMVRIRRFDVIHVHVANLQADVAAIAARLLRRPLYVKVATGGPLGEVRRFRRVSRLTRYVGLRSAARVQAISDEIESDVLSIGVPRARVLRIPNGIGLTAYAGVRAGANPDERARLQLPDGAVVVLFVGRFAVYKVVEDLLAAWAQLRESRSKRLVLVGQRHDAPDHARSHGADVVVRPWTADIGAYLRAADIFVLPSHSAECPTLSSRRWRAASPQSRHGLEQRRR